MTTDPGSAPRRATGNKRVQPSRAAEQAVAAEPNVERRVKITSGPPETDAERASRLEIDKLKVQHKLNEAANNASHERRKEWVLLSCAVGFSLFVGVAAIIVLYRSADPGKETAAWSAVTGLALAYAGYFTGRKAKSK